MSDKIVAVTESSFEQQVLQSSVPVLVDFWAEWCGPCKAIAPVLDEMAEEYAGKLVIAKVDVEESPGLTARFGIRGIPALMLFRDGQVADSLVGNSSKAQLQKFVEPHLA